MNFDYIAHVRKSDGQPQSLQTHLTETAEIAKLLAAKLDLWGSDNICIRKKKKFGGKKLAGATVCGALAFLGGMFMQKWKMVGIGGKWSKIGFYFA